MAGKRVAGGAKAPSGAGAKPVLLLLGGDHGKMEREIERLRAAALGENGSADVDALSVNAAESETSLQEVLSGARTIPFLSAKRFVLIRHVDRYDWNESDREALAAYVADPPDSSVVVLTADALPRNQRPFTTLAAAKAVVEFGDLLTGEGLEAFASRQAAEHGFALPGILAGALVARLGNEPARIRNEVAKLALQIAPRTEATESDVDALAPDLRVMQQIWDLTGALATRDFPKSLLLLRQALASGQIPFMIAGLLGKNLREALAAKQGQSAGKGYRELQAMIGSPFATNKAMEMARSFREDELVSLLRALHRADRRMKSGTPADAALEESLYGLAAVEARG